MSAASKPEQKEEWGQHRLAQFVHACDTDKDPDAIDVHFNRFSRDLDLAFRNSGEREQRVRNDLLGRAMLYCDGEVCELRPPPAKH